MHGGKEFYQRSIRLAGTITRKSVERFVTTVEYQLTHVASCFRRMNVACVHRPVGWGGSVGSVDPPPLVRTSSACHQNNLFITSIHADV